MNSVSDAQIGTLSLVPVPGPTMRPPVAYCAAESSCAICAPCANAAAMAPMFAGQPSSDAFATLIAISCGMIAAWKRDSRIDLAVMGAASLVLAVPSFWLGLMLLLLFGVTLHWLPVVGYVPFSESPTGAILYLILPIVTLTISESGVLTRMMRSSAIDVLRLDYVTHARAKGLSERAVLARHVFPNAFAPTLTLVGLTLGRLFGGIVVIETVFTLPGLGRLMVDSVLSRDYPVVQGCLLFTAVLYVLVNLIVDLLYPLFDPRVTLS